MHKNVSKLHSGFYNIAINCVLQEPTNNLHYLYYEFVNNMAETLFELELKTNGNFRLELNFIDFNSEISHVAIHNNNRDDKYHQILSLLRRVLKGKKKLFG